MKVALALLAIELFASSPKAQDSSSAVMIIQHVTVVNVITGEELKEQVVTVADGKIASVGPTAPAQRTSATVVEANGGYLIPGLWDMHVHVHDVGELPLYIANGVTGVRIMAGERDTKALRDELAAQGISPQLYLASAIVDGSSPTWPDSIVVKKPADARRTVTEVKASGADFIKVYDGVPREAYFALADEAKLQHIDFAGHVPEAISVQEASAAGQRSMEHLSGVALACSSKQESLNVALQHARFFLDRLFVQAEGFRSFDPVKCRALFAELSKNDTWQVPTLTVLRIWGRLDDTKTTSDPRVAFIEKKSRARWSDRIQPQIRRWNIMDYQMARGLFGAEEKIVGGMYRAGVPLLAGTDAMNPYCFPGFSLHDELALFVESGLSPLAALQSATLNPARFLKRLADLGTIEAGKNADMVLLRADPLADIHNTTTIEMVWLHGKIFDHNKLVDLKEAAKKR